MSVCSTVLPFISNPLTYLGMAGLGIAAKLLYAYSSYTFWPSFLTLTTLWRTVMVTISGLGTLWKYGAFTVLALFTTFSTSLSLAYKQGFTRETVRSFLFEGYDKVILSVKHLVTGLGELATWIHSSNGFCQLIGNNEILLSGLVSIWIGLAAYIFAAKAWNVFVVRAMERDWYWSDTLTVLFVVTFASLSIYGFDLMTQGFLNGKSLIYGAVDAVNNTTTASATS